MGCLKKHTFLFWSKWAVPKTIFFFLFQWYNTYNSGFHFSKHIIVFRRIYNHISSIHSTSIMYNTFKPLGIWLYNNIWVVWPWVNNSYIHRNTGESKRRGFCRWNWADTKSMGNIGRPVGRTAIIDVHKRIRSYILYPILFNII